MTALLGKLVRFIAAQWRAIDAERDGTPSETGRVGRFDWRVLVVLVTVAISLTIQEYVGGRDVFEKLWPYEFASPDRYYHLKAFAWWTWWRVAGYMILPMIVIACMPGERIRDYYISPKQFWKHLWIYLAMFGAVLPLVIAASYLPGFLHTYPFYRWANRSAFDLWVWETFYAAQFLSLEFFFRGFMLKALRPSLGANAVFVMIVPYCMIHYGKPPTETVAAIGAGLILGTLAMRTKSIWGGVLIHVGVAWTMDLLALGHCPDASTGRPCAGG